MKKEKIKKAIWIGLALVVGVLIGSWFFGGNNAGESQAAVEEEESTTWTCSMHPQIRQGEPGQCPICGMDLIPVSEGNGEGENQMAVTMSETAARLANVQTMTVGRGDAVKNIRLNGKVVPNERLVKTQSSHVSGRVEQLLVNTTGERVRQGQKLAEVYSPELITAQQEVLQAYAIRETQPALFQAAKDKLKALRISDKQVQEIVQSGEVQENIGIYADRSGIVLEKMVNVGDYLQKGEALFTIADLSQVWVVFDAYESDLPFINLGDQLTFSTASLPGKKFTGEITFVNPVVDSRSRTAEVRVEVKNSNGNLKPQMFTTATVEADLGDEQQLIIPKTAVMWTGERSVVYVKMENTEGPAFMLREVTLGPAVGNGYIISEGLETGEQVVVNGTFTVDAAAQLAGKPSMMNPEGGAEMTGHDHGNTDRSAPSSQENSASKKLDAEISPVTKNQLSDVLQEYFKLKDALIASQEDKASQAARGMEQKLSQVDMKEMKNKAHDQWMRLLPELKSSLSKINNESNIDVQRKSFIGISQNMLKVAEIFGPFDKPVYVLHCPMADNNAGADWLSASEEVLNPYYGDLMLRCGEVRERIE